MEAVYYSWVPSSIGSIWVASHRAGVCLVRFGLTEEDFLEVVRTVCEGPHIPDQEFNRGVTEEIKAYFDGRLTRFSCPLDPQGTPFEMKVWGALQRIPFGETRSYQEIAEEVGTPRGCRAVGGANGRNPIPLLIPCHRVIRKNGELGGFASGTETKAWLLRFENEISSRHKGRAA